MSRPHASADVFTAIADPTRRLILDQLGKGELPVTALAHTCARTMSAMSQQLRVLQDVGLVSVRHAGRERYYRLNPEPLQSVAQWLRHYEPFWDGKLVALAAYLDETRDAPEECADTPAEARADGGETEETR